MSFVWKCQPEAEGFIFSLLQECLNANQELVLLQDELLQKSSTRLLDWIDHFVVGSQPDLIDSIRTHGFTEELKAATYDVFYHPGAHFPRIMVKHSSEQKFFGLAVIVENISDYLGVRGLKKPIEGSLLSPFRRTLISSQNGISLWIIERRGTRVLEPTHLPNDYQEKYLRAQEEWKIRPRGLDDEEGSMNYALHLADELVKTFGCDLAATLVLEAERFYWQSKNKSAQIQKMRQDQLGMGWANHDHHTFRSSRTNFKKLVQLFKSLGFHCRESFYAGDEAGWGAQVMENPRSGHVLFLDVDLSPDEIKIDFAHTDLAPLPKLGTVGLWCALHGESILRGGMHHLEAQFFFENLTEDLSKVGISMMKPFSDFPYLKQAFTKGEVWPVSKERVELLLDQSYITKEQADKFLKEGALGSHLENLQRREGYKGFNQRNVSHIIKETDPRSSTPSDKGFF